MVHSAASDHSCEHYWYIQGPHEWETEVCGKPATEQVHWLGNTPEEDKDIWACDSCLKVIEITNGYEQAGRDGREEEFLRELLGEDP